MAQPSCAGTPGYLADEVSSDATNFTVNVLAADNAGAFTTVRFSVSEAAQTTASASWIPSPWTVVNQQGPTQRTPNLAPVLQEIVDRPGWASGNALSLVVRGTGRPAADSFDGGAGAAILHIEYVSS